LYNILSGTRFCLVPVIDSLSFAYLLLTVFTARCTSA